MANGEGYEWTPDKWDRLATDLRELGRQMNEVGKTMARTAEQQGKELQTALALMTSGKLGND